MNIKTVRRIPEVKLVMTTFPWSIDIEDSLGRARKLMEEQNIRHLSVTEEGTLVGVLTERDLSHLAKRKGHRTVRDGCVLGVYVVELTEPLDRVLLEMAERRIGSALVTKRDKLVGIFTVTDACRHFGELLQSMFPRGGDEAA